MADNNSVFDDDLEARMRRILKRRLAVWANHIVTADVTPSMVAHRAEGRCICDDCDAKRPQKPLVFRSSMQAARDRQPRPEACGNPPRPRFSTPMNSPIQVVALTERGLLFAMRLMDGTNRRSL